MAELKLESARSVQEVANKLAEKIKSDSPSVLGHLFTAGEVAALEWFLGLRDTL